MHSHLFSIFGLDVQSYGLCMALGCVAAYLLMRMLARREERSGRGGFQVDTLLMVCVVPGILGARLVYVVQNWSTEFASNPLQIFRLWEGGLVFYGGFLATLVALAIYARMQHVSLLRIFDLCAVVLPLAHAFGRVGCFMHGCCYGALTDKSCAIGVKFPAASPPWTHQVNLGLLSVKSPVSFPVYPTQLMEAGGLLVLCLISFVIYRRQSARAGLCTGLYCMLYGVLRFIIEIYRDDPRGETYLGLSFSQCISVGLLVFGFSLLTYALTRQKGNA